jgi:hypothetical protein
MIVRDLIKDAMHLIGAIDLDDEPMQREINICLTSLNNMLKQWSAQRLIIRASTPEDFTLTANVASYTIGAGGNFDTSKPIAVESGYIRDLSNVDNPLEIVTPEQYDLYEDKSLISSVPTQLAYDLGITQQAVQTGTIYLYPMPDKAYTLHLHSQKPLTSFSVFTETVTFESEYNEAIIYNLAIRIWRKFHGFEKPINADLKYLAEEALRSVERINSITPVASMDFPRTTSGFGYKIVSE